MSDAEYQRLGSSDEGWCCPRSLKEVLPFFFDSSSLSLSSDVDKERPDFNLLDHMEVSTSTSSLLNILYANCRSLVPYLDFLHSYAASCNPDIIALCKTWLDETITDCDIFVPGFYTIRRDRNHKGGGILLYIRDSVPIPSIICHASLELLFIEVALKQGPLNLGLFYRPTSASPHKTCLNWSSSLRLSPPPSSKLQFSLVTLVSTSFRPTTFSGYHLHDVSHLFPSSSTVQPPLSEPLWPRGNLEPFG